MAYIAHPLAASPQMETFVYTTAQSPLPSPVRTNTTEMQVKRICAAAQTDVLMAASRQALRVVYKNDTTSAAALTVNPGGSDTLDALTTYVYQPGDASALVNTTSTNWSVE
jgi:hypothetical protein